MGAAEAEIEEVSLDDRYAPQTDIRVRARWTGSGSEPYGQLTWLRVKETDFGQKGVDRIHSLLLTGLVNRKTVWVVFDDTSSEVGRVCLKATRN